MANNNETILKGRYRLLAQQGSGGMAVIYKAQDLELSRIVAVKILRPSLTTDPTFLTRFKNEARSIAGLGHPNILGIHDVGSDGPTQFIVMEFVDGTDLKKIIKTENKLGIERSLQIAIQICAGIGFAHRAGLVHADVKPQNMLVTRNDVVKVADFGIAQAFSDTQPAGERQQVVWGSPHYFAPEQARGERPTPACDVYSIGIVMFEMVTGRLPYVGENQQQLALAHIRDRIPLASEFNPEVPDALAQIIYKVMSKEPAARYRTADQLGHVLESYRDRGQQRSTQIEYSQVGSVSMPMSSPLDGLSSKASSSKSLSIFVSYAKKNSDDRTRIVDALQMVHSVWFDRELEDKGGQDWWNNILREVRQRQLFVFTLTPDSLLSFACYLEYTYAHELGKCVLPIRTNAGDIDYDLLPKPLRLNQVVDFTKPDGSQMLMRSIQELDKNGLIVPKGSKNLIPEPPVPFDEFRPIARQALNTKQELSESEQRLLVSELEDLVKIDRTRIGALILLQLVHDRNDTRRVIAEKITPLIKQYSPKSSNLIKKFFGRGN